MPDLQTTAAERSHAVFPAGSNGEFNLPDDLAMVIERGSGCRLWDTEGREYLDFSMGWGSSLVGHARPEIVDAVQTASAMRFELLVHYDSVTRAGRIALSHLPLLRTNPILCVGNRSDDVLPLRLGEGDDRPGRAS